MKNGHESEIRKTFEGEKQLEEAMGIPVKLIQKGVYNMK
jgi:hypothetical protein